MNNYAIETLNIELYKLKEKEREFKALSDMVQCRLNSLDDCLIAIPIIEKAIDVLKMHSREA